MTFEKLSKVSGSVPYREDAWRLRDVLADEEAIAKLERTPVDDLHERAGAAGQVTLSKTKDDGASLSKQRQIGPLLRRGFRYLGIKRERLGYFGRPTSHCLVDPDGAMWVAIRTELVLAPTLSRRFIVTVFDDGTCVETVGSRSTLKSSSRHVLRVGSDDVEADLDAHCLAVRAHSVEGARLILPIRSFEDIWRLEKVFFRYAIDDEVAGAMANVKDIERLNLRMFGTAALSILAVIAWLLVRIFG